MICKGAIYKYVYIYIHIHIGAHANGCTIGMLHPPFRKLLCLGGNLVVRLTRRVVELSTRATGDAMYQVC